MKSPLTAHMALLAMVVIWGVNFSVAKIALAHVSPLQFNVLRFPMAALLLFLVLKVRGELRLPSRAEWPRVLALGLLGNCLYQLCFIFGLDHTSASNAALLLAGTPIITALLSAALGQEHVPMRTWIGVLCTFAGIVLIVTGGTRAVTLGRSTLTGDVLMLGATITWAGYTVGSRPLVDRHGPILVAAWTLWIGAIALVLIGLPDIMRLDWNAMSLRTWSAIMYAGILSIGLGYMLWYYGVSKLGNTRTAAYSNLTPVVAMLGAWIFLSEAPLVSQVIGAAVIITGITIAQVGAVSPVPDVSPEV